MVIKVRKLCEIKGSYQPANSRLLRLEACLDERPPAVIGFRGSAVVRHVSTLNAVTKKIKELRKRMPRVTLSISPLGINRSIIISKLSQRDILEKEKYLSARKAVLREVLSHTQSVSSVMMSPEHTPMDVEAPEQSDANDGELQGSPKVARRLRSRQRQQRQKRGQERKALLHKQILKSTTRKRMIFVMSLRRKLLKFKKENPYKNSWIKSISI